MNNNKIIWKPLTEKDFLILRMFSSLNPLNIKELKRLTEIEKNENKQ